jgi:hypothetical protein
LRGLSERRALRAERLPRLALLAGCVIPLPAKAKVARIGNVPPSSGGIAVCVLFSADFSPDTPRASAGNQSSAWHVVLPRPRVTISSTVVALKIGLRK